MNVQPQEFVVVNQTAETVQLTFNQNTWLYGMYTCIEIYTGTSIYYIAA